MFFNKKRSEVPSGDADSFFTESCPRNLEGVSYREVVKGKYDSLEPSSRSVSLCAFNGISFVAKGNQTQSGMKLSNQFLNRIGYDLNECYGNPYHEIEMTDKMTEIISSNGFSNYTSEYEGRDVRVKMRMQNIFGFVSEDGPGSDFLTLCQFYSGESPREKTSWTSAGWNGLSPEDRHFYSFIQKELQKLANCAARKYGLYAIDLGAHQTILNREGNTLEIVIIDALDYWYTGKPSREDFDLFPFLVLS